MTEGKALVFLQKDKFDFYTPISGRVIEFLFVPEIIRDLEVINAELLESLIKLFVESNKLTPSDLVIVLSDNACFTKDFSLPVPPPILPQVAPNQAGQLATINAEAAAKIQEGVDFFIEHVPFENVISKKFPMENGTKVLATNADFYDAMKSAFEKVGFKVNVVLPGVVFENSVGSKTTLDIMTANVILQQAEMLREHNLLTKEAFQPVVEKEKESEKDYQVVDETENKPTKKNNKRLFLMIGVFIFLMIVLVLVYMGSLSQNL